MNKVFVALTILLSSCGAMKTANQSTSESINQTENQIIAFEQLYLKLQSIKNGDRVDLVEDIEITLFVDVLEASYSGKSGCNRYFGSIELINQDQIKFNIGGSTEMMCEDAIMLWETKYYKALMERNFVVTETESSVMLTEESGGMVLSFDKVNTPEEE